jgi:hypothetical protein
LSILLLEKQVLHDTKKERATGGERRGQDLGQLAFWLEYQNSGIFDCYRYV